MARGETKFGSLRNHTQLIGTGNPLPRRGGETGLTRRTIDTQIFGASAATPANYGIIHTVPAININRLPGATPGPVWQITDVRARFEAAGTDGGGATLQLIRVPSGTAKAAGISCLATPINLQGAINVNQDAPLVPIPAGAPSTATDTIQLWDGDSLALVPTGTLTAVAGVSVTVELMRLPG